jgi:hypothetical protein
MRNAVVDFIAILSSIKPKMKKESRGQDPTSATERGSSAM